MVAEDALPSFGQLNFGEAQLGDRRRTKALVRLADRIVKHPGGSLPDKLKSPADLKTLYRLVRPEAVTHAAVLEPARQRTRERMLQQDGTVLTIHDTTELDYTGKKCLTGLGQIGNGKRRGYLCHNSLAVVAQTREVLGLANQILFRRPKVSKKETREQARRRPTRESRLWKRGAEAVGSAPAGKTWVDVCDRGADLFEYLDCKHQPGEKYVVRSLHNRSICVEIEGKLEQCRLHEHARRLPELGQKVVRVPAKDNRPAREAVVRVAAGPVTISPPRQPRGEHGHEPLHLWVVCVAEVNPPAGVQPLQWILLTNVPTSTFAEACERIEWYECRWIIEEYHKGLKTGCSIEAPQFRHEDRLQPVIALLSVVAVLLLQMRDACRQPQAQERLATSFVPETHVEVLSVWRHNGPRLNWTVKEFCYALARLGGHLNRKSDGAPGWITLWRGWTKLQLMVEAVENARR